MSRSDLSKVRQLPKPELNSEKNKRLNHFKTTQIGFVFALFKIYLLDLSTGAVSFAPFYTWSNFNAHSWSILFEQQQPVPPFANVLGCHLMRLF